MKKRFAVIRRNYNKEATTITQGDDVEIVGVRHTVEEAKGRASYLARDWGGERTYFVAEIHGYANGDGYHCLSDGPQESRIVTNVHLSQE